MGIEELSAFHDLMPTSTMIDTRTWAVASRCVRRAASTLSWDDSVVAVPASWLKLSGTFEPVPDPLARMSTEPVFIVLVAAAFVWLLSRARKTRDVRTSDVVYMASTFGSSADERE